MAKGKPFAIMWGLRGWLACKRMHTVQMTDSKIPNYVRDNFELPHLNQIGAREVIDFDSHTRGEKALDEAYGIRFTPTIQLFSGDNEMSGCIEWADA